MPDELYADFAISLAKAVYAVEALEYLDNVSPQTYRSRPELHFYKGLSYTRVREYEKAITEYSQYLQSTPQAGEQPGVLYNLATTQYKWAVNLESAGKYADAQKAYESSVKNYDAMGPALKSDAIAVGKRADAVEDLQRLKARTSKLK